MDGRHKMWRNIYNILYSSHSVKNIEEQIITQEQLKGDLYIFTRVYRLRNSYSRGNFVLLVSDSSSSDSKKRCSLCWLNIKARKDLRLHQFCSLHHIHDVAFGKAQKLWNKNMTLFQSTAETEQPKDFCSFPLSVMWVFLQTDFGPASPLQGSPKMDLVVQLPIIWQASLLSSVYWELFRNLMNNNTNLGKSCIKSLSHLSKFFSKDTVIFSIQSVV